ncbi:MAG TPA: MBL fold metallo-hydrolase [Myxococcales bacterium]|nr:MBL fold metallo-hydrolase [Myxococcales bacterium]
MRVLLPALLLAGCAGPSRREPAVYGLPRDDAAAPLSVVWVGHATVLLRFGHRFVLTDPNLGGDILFQPRITPPSVSAAELPPLQLIIVSHLHIDHFDVGTFQKLPRDTEVIFPPGTSAYTGLIKQEPKDVSKFWEPIVRGGLTVTPVPVKHVGGRYLVDALWNHGDAGYVVDGAGKRVFFAGDTGYDHAAFIEIGKRFPGIDLALIPIAPAAGGNPNHANPHEALEIFRDVGARYMIPIHFEAYHSMAVPIDVPRRQLEDEVQRDGLQDRVFALYTGERWIDPGDGHRPRVTREK